jgi:thioredoxin-like negative regulator of GroEL
MAEQITLPAPVLTADFIQRHEGTEGVAPLLRTLGETIARQTVLESLSAIRSTHQGVKLATETDAAQEARADADEALDNHTAGWDDLAKMAHEVQARDAAIEVLAGMVARLIAEKY